MPPGASGRCSRRAACGSPATSRPPPPARRRSRRRNGAPPPRPPRPSRSPGSTRRRSPRISRSSTRSARICTPSCCSAGSAGGAAPARSPTGSRWCAAMLERAGVRARATTTSPTARACRPTTGSRPRGDGRASCAGPPPSPGARPGARPFRSAASTARSPRRFRGTALEGRLFAKTGTLNATSALSGYMIARSGRTLLFSALRQRHARRRRRHRGDGRRACS